MRNLLTSLLLGGLLVGCGTASGGLRIPGGSPAGAVVVDDDAPGRGRASAPRALGVPPGHYPPPGQCRVWYPGTPPGRQPPPQRCSSLSGRVPAGAFVLYNGREWDTGYDWRDHERRNRGSVPGIILDLMASLDR